VIRVHDEAGYGIENYGQKLGFALVLHSRKRLYRWEERSNFYFQLIIARMALREIRAGQFEAS
jgi:hypothetical protein